MCVRVLGCGFVYPCSITWTWQEADVPDFQAVSEVFPGSGHSKLFPLQQSQWDTMVAEMFDNDFIDMNTRFVRHVSLAARRCCREAGCSQQLAGWLPVHRWWWS